jgi:hypothetical protein
VPACCEKTRPWVREGKLVVVGVVQEQHPNRPRLFAQWQGLDWPILHDPINVLGLRGVPVMVAVDEHGIVRGLRPSLETLEADFLDRTFSADAAAASHGPARPDVAALRRAAQQGRSVDAWRSLADALVLWEGVDHFDEAMEAYRRAIGLQPDDGDAHFRLGVCHRMRYESPLRRPGDFQTAVDQWSKARAIDPNQYIWRRRIEQYGPRLNKPYPFYDWVDRAAAEITARGERPVPLRVLPTGSERAQPASQFAAAEQKAESPDPEGRILRDAKGLVDVEVAVVPPRVKPGDSARVYVTLRPSADRKAHWNNEAEPLRVWVDPPQGWEAEPRWLEAPQGTKPQTTEARRLELEVRAGAEAHGTATFRAYALYYVCEDVADTCLFLRQDIPIEVDCRQ